MGYDMPRKDAANYEKLGKEIRKLREERNIGLREFAEMLSVNPSHISLIETGKKKVSDSLLHEMAHVLNVPEEKLFAIVERIPYSLILALERRPTYRKLVTLLERELDRDDIVTILNTLVRIVEKQGGLSKDNVNDLMRYLCELHNLEPE